MRAYTFCLFVLLVIPLSFCAEWDDWEVVDIAVVGAGWGGSYAAWRLATSLNPSENKIRMFEKLDRIGGRAFFVDQSFAPELNGLEENMGGYRWNEKEHVLINAVSKTVFNIPSRCFSKSSYVNQTTGCSTNVDPQYTYARGRFLTPAEQADSTNWANYDLGTASWTSLANRPNPSRIATQTAFPFLTTANFPDFTSCNDTARWEAVLQATNRVKACNPSECFVPGGNPMNVPIKYFVQNLFPQDFFAADEVVGTNTGYSTRHRYQSNIYSSGISSAISFGLTGCGGSAPFQVVLEGGGRRGYATAATLMVNAAAAAQGVPVSTFLKFDHQLYTVRKVINRYALKFTNNVSILAKKVILNIGLWNYVRHLDKHDNILFDNASTNLKAVYSMSELSASKTYLLYEPAWWIQAGLVTGSIQTDDTFKYIRFHQGHVLCTNQADPSTCRGLILASYQIQHIPEHKSIDWQNNGPDVSSNLYVARRSNARDAHVLDMLHERLMTIVSTPTVTGGAALINFTASIDPPTLGLFVNWFEDPWNKCGAYVGAVSIAPGTLESTSIRPIPNEEIYLANIDWMTSFSGFAEASLIMAERVVHRHFGLAQPAWLPNVWYDYVINKFNM